MRAIDAASFGVREALEVFSERVLDGRRKVDSLMEGY